MQAELIQSVPLRGFRESWATASPLARGWDSTARSQLSTLRTSSGESLILRGPGQSSGSVRAPEQGAVMRRGGEGGWRASRSKGWGRFAQAAEVIVWRLGEMAETWARDPGSGEGTQPEALLSLPLLSAPHS